MAAGSDWVYQGMAVNATVDAYATIHLDAPAKMVMHVTTPGVPNTDDPVLSQEAVVTGIIGTNTTVDLMLSGSTGGPAALTVPTLTLDTTDAAGNQTIGAGYAMSGTAAFEWDINLHVNGYSQSLKDDSFGGLNGFRNNYNATHACRVNGITTYQNGNLATGRSIELDGYIKSSSDFSHTLRGDTAKSVLNAVYITVAAS